MIWFILIFPVALVLIAFLLEWLFFSSSKKEEQSDSHIERTHAPKRRTVTSLIISIALITIFIVGTLAIILTKQELDIGFLIAYPLSCTFVISIPLLIFFICISNYEVITKGGIKVHRMFKKVFVSYNQMSNYSFSYNQLSVYDKTDKLLFFVGDMRIGVTSIVNALENHGVYRKI